LVEPQFDQPVRISYALYLLPSVELILHVVDPEGALLELEMNEHRLKKL
jgi:hypothetical protein